MGNHSPLISLDFHASQEVKNPRKRSIDSLDSSSNEKSLFVFVFRSKVRNSAELSGRGWNSKLSYILFYLSLNHTLFHPPHFYVERITSIANFLF